MATRDEVYFWFGMAAEAAQLVEMQLGTLLARQHLEAEGLFDVQNPDRAVGIYHQVRRQTLGRLLRGLGSTEAVAALETELQAALEERNRLTHHFFRQHNARMNSDEGRDIMVRDLQEIHATLVRAYTTFALVVYGNDLAEPAASDYLTEHLPGLI